MELAELYMTYYQQLTYFARRLVEDTIAAHDVVIDSLISANKYMSADFSDRQQRCYLFTVVRNKCMDIFRRKDNFEEWNDTLDVAYYQAYRLDKEPTIEMFIAKLPPARRRILELDMDGHTTPEICQLLGQKADSIYVTRKRALNDLKKMLLK